MSESAVAATDGTPGLAEPPIEVVVSPLGTDRARVLSRRSFSRGDAIWPVSGRSTAPSPCTIQLGCTMHVEDAGALGHLNHSCKPSAVIDASALPMVFALRDIAPGDELTVFYPSTEWELARPFICSCGASECLRFVAGARHLAVDTLARYFVNPHIRRLVNAAIAQPRQTVPSGTSRDALVHRA